MGFKKGIKQGFYEPKFPEKWIITEAFDMKGKGIKYRSSWEHTFCKFADYNPDIVRVNSEGVIVPYFNPVKEKIAKYYIDFAIETKKGKLFLVEVKPYNETIPPKKPKSNTEKSMMNFQKAIATYAINQAKWLAAKEYAAQRGAEFIIITEKELGI
jgi:hypothetical protein